MNNNLKVKEVRWKRKCQNNKNCNKRKVKNKYKNINEKQERNYKRSIMIKE